MKTSKVKIITLVLVALITAGLAAWALFLKGSEVNYKVNFYYESTELGTYDEPVSVTKKALRGTAVTAPGSAETGFVLNPDAEGTVASVDRVAEGTELRVYYDRIRADVTFDYLSKEDATYTAVYGVGLLNAEGVALTDSLPLLPTDAYLNGVKTELTADSFKNLTRNTMVSFAHTAGDWTYDEGYTPVHFTASYLYAPAVVGNQSLTTTVKLSTMENAVSNTGIAICSGEEAAVVYITGSGKNLSLILGGVDGFVTGLLPEDAVTFADGACKFAATVKDGKLYLSINDKDCGYTAISSLLPGYTAESEVAIGLYAKNAAGGKAVFTDVAIETEGDFNVASTTRWENKITFVPADSNMKVDFINGTVNFGEGAKSRITLDGSSTAWELSGTVNRNSVDKMLYFGFRIGDGSGKTLELNAYNFGFVAGAVFADGHTDPNYDRYAGHSTSLITGYHKENKVQKLFTREGEATETQMHFKAMIADDVFYVWFWYGDNNPTLCWRVPLTETLVYNPKYPSAGTWENPFRGFREGSSYTLELFNNGGNPAGSFTGLSVKTGRAVDTTQIPEDTMGDGIGADGYGFGGYRFSEGQKRTITFNENSTAWELSGTVNRYTVDKMLYFGFRIGDGTGKTLELNAYNYGFVVGGLWSQKADAGYDRYAGHSNSIISKYHKENTVQKRFTREGEATERRMNFKAMIVDDVFYVWYWFGNDDPTLCWKVPLTETLVYNERYPSAGTWANSFKGFEEGSSYTLELFNNGGNPAGSFTNLSVKTGDDVDTTQIPEDTIDDVLFGEGQKKSITFDGNATAWELSGTVNRDSIDKMLYFGFRIGDGTGKTLELNAYNYGFVVGGLWSQQAGAGYDRYTGHSNSIITKYHQENTVQKRFTREGEATESQMHFKAMIVDDVFYVWYWFGENEPTLCWRVPLAETLKIREGDTNAWNDPFDGFAEGSSYTLELFNNGGNPAGSFTDLSVKTGDDVDTTQIPEDTIDDVIIGEGQKKSITFDGNSTAWELSGTINRANTDKIMSFGFRIGDGTGKTLELNAHNIGFVIGGRYTQPEGAGYDRYAGHSNGTITDYHLDNVVQRKFTREDNGEDTELQMHFKAMIVDDVFYVWYWFGENEPTLCWRVPLAETLTIREGDTTAWNNPFTGFAEGSSYTLELFNNGGNPAGSFTDLSVKTGDDVDTTQIPEDTIDDVIIGAGEKKSITFADSSATWELSGTVNRDSTDKMLWFGFRIGDGSGKTLELNAYNIGFVVGGLWSQPEGAGYDRYAGHSNGTITDYHLDNVVQRKFTRENEATESQIHFKAKIVDDVFYVWYWFGENEPTLCWRVPLAETLKKREGDTNAWNNPFKGFAEGSSYTLELFNNGGNPAGSFTDLSVKTGDDVDTTGLEKNTAAVDTPPAAIADLVYSGSAQELVTAGTAAGGTMQYKLGDGEWSADIPTAINAGTYTVHYKAVGDSDHYDSAPAVDPITVTIAPKAVTVTANNTSKAVGTKDPNLTATVSGTVGSDTASYDLSRAVGEDVGTYAITASGDTAQGNYTVTYAPGTFTITDTVKFGVGQKESVTFADSSATWELSGTVNRDSTDKMLWFGFRIGDGSGKTLELNAYNIGFVVGGLWSQQAGAGYDRYTGHATSIITDYHLENVVQRKFTRENEATESQMHFKAMIVDDVFYVWYWFGENEPTLCWRVPLAEMLKRREGDTNAWNDPFDGFAEGSSYTLELFNNGDNPAGSFTDLSVKTGDDVDTTGLEKTTATVDTAPAAIADLVYSGSTQELVTAGTAAGGTMQYKLGDGEWSADIPTAIDMGTYSVFYKVVGDSYHNDSAPAVDPITVTIAPKAVTVTANNASKMVGTEDPDLTATVSGTVGSDTVSYDLSRAAGEDAGTYDITASGDTAQGNYTVTYAPGTFTITDTVIIGVGQKESVTFADSSATWELSGTVNRDSVDKMLWFGFRIGDGTGKTLELNAYNIGFVVGGLWSQPEGADYDRYTGYATSIITDYHLENVVQRKFTRENEATESQMHFKAMIVDDVFYVWYWFGDNEPTLCWRVPLAETLTIREGDTNAWNNPFDGFAEGSSYTLELFNNGDNPAGSFTDLSVKTGDDVDVTQVPGDTLDDVTFSAGEKKSITFADSSATWELSGTVNRDSTDKMLWFGFRIGDGTGKTLELNAYNIGFVVGGLWSQPEGADYDRYTGHATGIITDYHLENVVQRKFTRENEATESQMHFKAMIVDDVFYVWYWFGDNEPTLCWRVPLAETLTIREGDTNAWNNPFDGFAEGSSYTLELFNNGGNPPGSFTNLSVKTGRRVDTSQVPSQAE